MKKSSTVGSNRARNKAAWISFLASIFVFGMKVAAYYYTNSTAVLSDALESTVNVVAAAVALIVIRYAAKPADEDHPYGHGKLEYFSAAFEGGLIFFAALMIIRESIQALIFGSEAHHLESGFLIMGLAAIFNLILGIYLKRVGGREHSEALKASGAHVISDVWTTVGVLGGLALLIFTGWTWLDSVVAILVGLNLAYDGYKIARKSGGNLVDETDPEVLEDLAKVLEKNRRPGIIDIHQLRVIRSGRFHHIDAHLVIPEYWDISKAHNYSGDFEAEVVRDYVFDGEIAFHLDPCKRAYCKMCTVEGCPVRQTPFQTRNPFTVASITGSPNNN
jgi:cation diffusion facilitator family transporter